MLQKNILKGLVLMSLVAYVQAQKNEPSLNIDCLLVTAQGKNSIRIERYAMDDLELSGALYLSKKERSQRRIIELDIQEPESSLLGMQWDENGTGCVTIHTKNKTEFLDYSLNVMALFNDEFVYSDGIFKVCFDCEMVPLNDDIRGASHRAEWKSCAQVTMPFGSEIAALHFVFDNKVKAVCGLFISNEAFSEPLRYAGKIHKSDALESGLLRPIAREKANDLLETVQEQIIEAVENSIIQAAQELSSEINDIIEEKELVLESMVDAYIDQVQEFTQTVVEEVVQELAEAAQEIEAAILVQEEKNIDAQAPGIWNVIHQATVTVFQAIKQSVSSSWNSVTSFLFGNA